MNAFFNKILKSLPLMRPWSRTASAAITDFPEPAMPNTVTQPGVFCSRYSFSRIRLCRAGRLTNTTGLWGTPPSLRIAWTRKRKKTSSISYQPSSKQVPTCPSVYQRVTLHQQSSSLPQGWGEAGHYEGGLPDRHNSPWSAHCRRRCKPCYLSSIAPLAGLRPALF